MCVGHPGLVRFGLEGFNRTLDRWFLPDAYTPESPAYAWMTIGGMNDMAQAMRAYSDPPGYVGADGKRLEQRIRARPARRTRTECPNGCTAEQDR